MCEMHREHLLSIPMVTESVYILKTLLFLGVEVLVGIAITIKLLIGGIFINGFVTINSFTQAPIFNFLVLYLSLPLFSIHLIFFLIFLTHFILSS